MNEATLPSGWAMATVGDLADYVNGRAFKPTEWKETGKPIIRIQNLNDEGAKYNFSPEQHEDKYRVKNGDLLFAWSASLGAHIWHGGDAWLNQHIFNVHPKSCTTKSFVFYLLSKITAELYAKAHGSGMVHVTKGKFESTEVALPPLNEQHRIVTKIEELFSELDKGIENLKTAQAQIKVYRQALLKHAFEGKLTAAWREQNRNKLETAAALQRRIQQERAQRYQQQLADWEANGKQGSKPKAPKPLPPLTAEELAELPELPEGWSWEKLGNVADLIGGVTKGKDLEGKEKISLPYLRVANVQDGYLDLKEIKNIGVEPKDKEKYRLEYGDVLYTEGGDKDKLGRGAVWRSQIENCIHQNHIFRARILGGVISPEILSLYSQTRSAKKYFFRHAKQTTNLASINLTVLANLPVAILSQSEQKQILQEIEERLSEADQLDQTLTASLQQAEALRQSILKKAFSGQLVAQDANDEPAGALLARIKAGNPTAMARPRKPKQAAAPAPVKTNVAPFPVKLPSISPTDLHAGILAWAYQRHELTPKHLAHFGHVKAEKIAHLVESHLGIDLGREPVKDAAGPNDYPRLMKVESRARKANWFDVRKKRDGDAYEFCKKRGFDALLLKARNALGDRADEVDALIGVLLPLNSRQAEIVATLYAAWNNLLLLGKSPGNEDIVREARENWHGAKLKIERDKFFRGLEWMREHGLVPAGKGRYVVAKAVHEGAAKREPAARGTRKTGGKAI